MPSAYDGWSCDFCGDEDFSYSEAEEHEKTCAMNPEVIEAKRQGRVRLGLEDEKPFVPPTLKPTSEMLAGNLTLSEATAQKSPERSFTI